MYFIILEGSVEVITTRFFKAILSLENEYVYWPGTEAKKIIKDANESFLGFPDCLGFIDGTHIFLDSAPTWRRDEFYCRKGAYSIQTMAICDHKRRIRYLETGFFGSSHDMRVLNESDFGQNPTKYCIGNEYILGDGGYSAFHYLVPVSKKPRNGTTADDDQRFNTYISQMRIKIEHAFGILKARFQSLKQLRLQITSKEDVAFASAWIRVCVILNNFLINRSQDSMTMKLEKKFAKKEHERLRKLDEATPNTGDCENEDDEENTLLAELYCTETGKEKYATIKKIVLEEMDRREAVYRDQARRRRADN